MFTAVLCQNKKMSKHTVPDRCVYTLLSYLPSQAYGCSALVKLDVLSTHLHDCEFNPKKPVPCEKGCGSVIPKDELKVNYLVKVDPLLIDHYQMFCFLYD